MLQFGQISPCTNKNPPLFHRHPSTIIDKHASKGNEIDFFMDPLNIYANDALTALLKQALSQSVITLEDFKRDDTWILNTITESQNHDLIQQLQQINSHVILIEDEDDYDIHRKPKPRMIDPLLYLENGTSVPLSTVLVEINDLINLALKKLHHGTYLKVIPY